MRSFGPAAAPVSLPVASAVPAKAHSDWETLRRLFPYLWTYKWRVLAALAFVLPLSGWTWRADRLVYDIGLSAWRRPVPEGITIVAIDDASVAAIGRWPWPRQRHAELIDDARLPVLQMRRHAGDGRVVRDHHRDRSQGLIDLLQHGQHLLARLSRFN